MRRSGPWWGAGVRGGRVRACGRAGRLRGRMRRPHAGGELDGHGEVHAAAPAHRPLAEGKGHVREDGRTRGGRPCVGVGPKRS